MFEYLAEMLAEAHGVNENGVRQTKWSDITGNFKLLVCTANGTSGLATYQGQHIYFYRKPNGTFIVQEDK